MLKALIIHRLRLHPRWPGPPTEVNAVKTIPHRHLDQLAMAVERQKMKFIIKTTSFAILLDMIDNGTSANIQKAVMMYKAISCLLCHL